MTPYSQASPKVCDACQILLMLPFVCRRRKRQQPGGLLTGYRFLFGISQMKPGFDFKIM